MKGGFVMPTRSIAPGPAAVACQAQMFRNQTKRMMPAAAETCRDELCSAGSERISTLFGVCKCVVQNEDSRQVGAGIWLLAPHQSTASTCSAAVQYWSRCPARMPQCPRCSAKFPEPARVLLATSVCNHQDCLKDHTPTDRRAELAAVMGMHITSTCINTGNNIIVELAQAFWADRPTQVCTHVSAHQRISGRLPHALVQSLHGVAAQLATRVLRLAVGAGAEAAGAERHNLDALIAPDLQRPADPNGKDEYRALESSASMPRQLRTHA